MHIAIVRNTPEARRLRQLGMQNKEYYKEEDIEAVKNALSAGGHDVTVLEGDVDLIPRLENLLSSLDDPADLMVFNLAYGVQGECRYTHIPSILELAGIPYVCSGPRAHTIALDKYLAKVVLRSAGLPTPAFQLFNTPDDTLTEGLIFPLIVKPKMESTSFGIQVVEDETSLRKAVAAIIDEFQQPALVERFISGMEVNCGVLGNDPPKALPVLEIDFGNMKGTSRILSFETKRDRVASHVCPARMSDELTGKVRDLTVAAFKALGCRDCARVDFRIDDDGNPWILELNSMAAIHQSGSYYDAWSTLGKDYQQLIQAVLLSAVERYR